MSQLGSASSIELEIQTLLKQHSDLEKVADLLVQKYQKQNLSLNEFESLATFFLYSGQFSTLANFIAEKASTTAKIPWGHFTEALFLSSPLIGPQVKRAILDGAAEQLSLSHLARSRYLDGFEEELIQIRHARQKNIKDRMEQIRQQLTQEYELMKSQGMFREEEMVLNRMANFFPNDKEVAALLSSFKERQALEFAIKRPQTIHKVFIPFYDRIDEATQKELDLIEAKMAEVLATELTQNPEIASTLACDFVIAMMNWENFEAGIRLLNLLKPQTVQADWLRAEVLLRGRKLADLLHHLTFLEAAYKEDPETIYRVQYLRSQALWGLNQRTLALEILESLVRVNPQYRSASALLDEWKEDGP